MAKANEEIVAAELEGAIATSRDGSVGRLTDVQSDGGTSAIAHPTFRGQGVSTEVSRPAVEVTQDSLLDRQDLQGCQGSPAGVGSGVQGPVSYTHLTLPTNHSV